MGKNSSVFRSCVFTVLLAFLVCGSVEGKPSGDRDKIPFRYETRLGWGGYPMNDVSMLVNTCSGCCYVYYDDIISPSTLYSSYSGKVYMTGVISAEFSYYFKRWFSLAVSLNYNGVFGSTFSGMDDSVLSRDNGAVVTLYPQARFSYLTREYVRLYSAVGLGVGYATFRSRSELYPCFHLTPIGISVGRKVFGFCELGTGMLFMGVMGGIGVRF